MWTLVGLFFSGVVAGTLNSVAGGGSFIVFPALVFSGLTPVVANATCAAGLVPASFSSLVAYRKDVALDRVLVVLGIASTLGGLVGAVVLLSTKESTFVWVLPILLAFAAAVFTFGPRIAKHLQTRFASTRSLMFVFFLQVVIATYGGYFGGGMGILMLATFAFIGLAGIHAMNGIKSALTVAINGTAVIAFVASHKVAPLPWSAVMLGGVVGGYFGARLARRIAPARVRRGVIIYAWAMTAYFAWRTYARG